MNDSMLALAFWYMTVQPAAFRPADLLQVGEAAARERARYRMEVALTCAGSGCPAKPVLSASATSEDASDSESN